jgi:hypothetical protein
MESRWKNALTPETPTTFVRAVTQSYMVNGTDNALHKSRGHCYKEVNGLKRYMGPVHEVKIWRIYGGNAKTKG